MPSRLVTTTGKPQVLSTSLVADLETPVSAYLKLAEGRPYSALFESVEGGATIGRYSFITLKPDLVWRCFGGRAEINRRARAEAGRFEPLEGEALESLRALVRGLRDRAARQSATHGVLPDRLHGLRHGAPHGAPAEREPAMCWVVPDAVFFRPTLVAVFDRVEDLVTIVTPVWPRAGRQRRSGLSTGLRAARRCGR